MRFMYIIAHFIISPFLSLSSYYITIYFEAEPRGIKPLEIKNNLIFYLNQNEELKKIIELEKEFKIVLFSKKKEQLDLWLEKAKKLNVTELNSFINLIESDIDAVKNAIIYDYSNGLTEGFNNKTKVIKRQMYGRCKFDLLRLKILAFN